MPALQPVAHVCQVSVLGIIAGIACNNVFHVGGNPASGDFFSHADLDAIAGGVFSAFHDTFRVGLSNQYTLEAVVAKDLTSDLAPTAVAGTPAAGAVGATALPANVAMCLSWVIPRRYRGGHPRTYLGGLPDGQQSNPNTWSATAITNFTNFASDFKDAVNAIAIGSGGLAELVTVHRVHAKAVLIPPTVDVITAVSVDSRLDSQRRRLGRDR